MQFFVNDDLLSNMIKQVLSNNTKGLFSSIEDIVLVKISGSKMSLTSISSIFVFSKEIDIEIPGLDNLDGESIQFGIERKDLEAINKIILANKGIPVDRDNTNVSIMLLDNKLRIKYKGGNYVINIERDVDDIVKEYDIENKIQYIPFIMELQAEQINYLFKSILYAVGNDYTRPSINGVNLLYDPFVSPNIITARATDSYRLAAAYNNVVLLQPVEDIPPMNIVVPQELIKTLLFINEPIFLRFTENQKEILITNDFGMKILSRSIIENTIPYEKIISMQRDYKCIVNRLEFIGAIQSVIIASREEDYVHIRIDNSSSNSLHISRESERGQGEYTLSIGFENPPTGFTTIDLTFYQKYLIQALKSLSTNMVRLSFSEMSVEHITMLIDEPNGGERYAILQAANQGNTNEE